MAAAATLLPSYRHAAVNLSSPELSRRPKKGQLQQQLHFEEWPQTTDTGTMYKILMGGLVPRPIAFVSTIAEKTGHPHLSPFSMVQIVSIQPLVLMLTAPRPSPAHVKQTMGSITRLKQFTINILSNSTVGQQLGSGVPFYVEEWIERGVIHWADGSSICAPRIAESAFSLECELFQPPKDAGLRIDPCVSRANIILGVVKRFYVRSDVLNPTGNMVDPVKLDPILRLNVATL